LSKIKFAAKAAKAAKNAKKIPTIKLSTNLQSDFSTSFLSRQQGKPLCSKLSTRQFPDFDFLGVLGGLGG